MKMNILQYYHWEFHWKQWFLSGIGVSNDLLDIIEDENIEVSEMGGYLG